MSDCVFCKLISKEIPTKFLYEDKDILAFKDRNPLAPIHILIIPREHIENITKLEEKDQELMGKMILLAKTLAEKGYKLLFRVKENGGQEVPHIHLHLIGGAKLTENIHSV